MPDNLIENPKTDDDKNAAIKSWMMVALTAVFVFLYAAALVGWLKPLTDMAMVSRLEPVIFVIIGYYFGRLPAQQNEKTLKDEIARQSQKADAAQQIKEKSQQEREVLEEKIKNAKIVLDSNPISLSSLGAAENVKSLNAEKHSDFVQNSVAAAMSILNS